LFSREGIQGWDNNSYSLANLLITGQPGYSSPIILAHLSKASHPASSAEAQIFSKSHISFIE